MTTCDPHSFIESLPQRMRDSEEQAFRDFAWAFGRVFRRYFLDHGLKPFEAEDLAIELIADIPLKVLRGRFHEQESGTFEGWVLTLMRNAGRDWWRKKKRRVELVPIEEDAAEPTFIEPTDDTALALAVRDALARLSGAARQIIELRNLNGDCDYAEIAAQLQITSGAARVRHSRALAQLSEVLSHDPRVRRVMKAEN